MGAAAVVFAVGAGAAGVAQVTPVASAAVAQCLEEVYSDHVSFAEEAAVAMHKEPRLKNQSQQKANFHD